MVLKGDSLPNPDNSYEMAMCNFIKAPSIEAAFDILLEDVKQQRKDLNNYLSTIENETAYDPYLDDTHKENLEVQERFLGWARSFQLVYLDKLYFKRLYDYTWALHDEYPHSNKEDYSNCKEALLFLYDQISDACQDPEYVTKFLVDAEARQKHIDALSDFFRKEISHLDDTIASFDNEDEEE